MHFHDLYSDDLRLCLLPPREMCAACDKKCIFSADDYSARLAQVQRLRAEVFMADGAITTGHLDEGGGYITSLDHEAWHVYLTDNGQARACYTLMLHRKGVKVEDLRVHELLARMDPSRRGCFESAIQLIMREASERRVGFGEAAAWAVQECMRNRRASMMFAFAGWSLYQMLGNALVIAAPTLRHHTAALERRLGAVPLTDNDSPLGIFYNPCHRCDMEFVWFDTERPMPKFAELVAEMRCYFDGLSRCACRRH